MMLKDLVCSLRNLKELQGCEVNSIGFRSDGCFTFHLKDKENNKEQIVYINEVTGEVIEICTYNL